MLNNVRISLSQVYYKVGKNRGFIFFQSVCEELLFYILQFVFLGRQKKMATFISCCGNEETDDVWENNNGVEALIRKSQTRFQIICLVLSYWSE